MASSVKRWLLTLVATGVVVGCSQVSAEEQVLEFAFTDTPLWDLSGHYEFTCLDDILGGGDGVELTLDLVQDGKGKVTGGGVAHITDGAVVGDLPFTVKGKVSGADDVAVLAMKISVKGTLVEGETSYKIGLSLGIILDTVSAPGELAGTLSGKAALPSGSYTFNDDLTLALPAAMNGTSALVITFDDSDAKPLGAAVLTLSDGRELNFAASGSYTVDALDSDSGMAVFKAKGDGDASFGMKFGVVIQVTGPLANIILFQGKLLGQTIFVADDFVPPPPPPPPPAFP